MKAMITNQKTRSPKTVIDNVDEGDIHEMGDKDCGVPYEEIQYVQQTLMKLFAS